MREQVQGTFGRRQRGQIGVLKLTARPNGARPSGPAGPTRRWNGADAPTELRVCSLIVSRLQLPPGSKPNSVRRRRSRRVARLRACGVYGGKRVRKPGAGLVIVAGRSEVMRRRHQNAADRGGVELRIAFEQQRRNAADLGGGKRCSRRYLVCAVW